MFRTLHTSQVKFILPQRYKHKTQAGNSERPHGHLSQPHPKQQLNLDKTLYNLKTITQKKEKTQYSHTQRNKHKNYCFLIITLNPNYDRAHFKPANTINIKHTGRGYRLGDRTSSLGVGLKVFLLSLPGRVLIFTAAMFIPIQCIIFRLNK